MLDKLKTLKKSHLFDALIILFLMALSVVLRLPTLELNPIFIDQRDFYRSEEGLPYLYDPDSYYYARKTREIVETNDFSLLSDVSDDSLRTKTGEKTHNFFPVSMAIIYKFSSLFANSSIESFFVFIGPIIYSLSVIPVYIFVRKRSNSRFGAAFAGFFIALAPAFFFKTSFISFDTDVLLAVLPLTYMTCFLESLKTEGKKQYIYLLTSFLAFVMLSLSWSAYGPYYYLLAVSFVITLIVFLVSKKPKKLIHKDQKVRNSFILLSLCTLFCLIAYKSLDTSALETALTIILPNSSVSNYPSASVFVSELDSVKLFPSIENLLSIKTSSIVSRLGGIFAFILGLISFLVLITKSITKKSKETSELLIIFVWFFATIIASALGERFAELLMLPWSLCLGLGLSQIYDFLDKRRYSLHFAVLCIAFIISPFAKIKSLTRLTPSADDALLSASSYIKEDIEKSDSKDDSIIFSWWDLGYIYEYFADTRTYCDGGTYDGKEYIYIARALLSETPEESERIIKTELEKHNLKEKKVYFVITKDMTTITKAISYYANWDIDKPKDKTYDYDTSIMKSFFENKKSSGNFHFETFIEDEIGRYDAAIFSLLLP